MDFWFGFWNSLTALEQRNILWSIGLAIVVTLVSGLVRILLGATQKRLQHVRAPKLQLATPAPTVELAPTSIGIGVGTLLGERYRLDSRIGAGGMGVVYCGHDLVLDRDVAIKVLNAWETSEEARARLMREAHATAKLKHPNIAVVYDVGMINLGEKHPSPFIVMELVDGKGLNENKDLTLPQILDLSQQICDALEHAHSVGLVHRDLKPENILVEQQNNRLTAKIVDFGLAQFRSSAHRTPDDSIVGTVYYISPEQIEGRAVDGRADLYSFGAMLYELVTGRVPFADINPVQILEKHLNDSPLPPHELRPEIPPPLEAIILKLLAKQPAERFQSAYQVENALREIAPISRPPLARLNNLPLLPTSFIGREHEIEEVLERLTATRLLTLTGTGGVGKTRLALQVGRSLIDQYPDGVWNVELAALTDPRLVAQQVASVLSVREELRRPLITTLAESLRDKTLLLLIDNCEHLISACATLAHTLLGACPNVRILATSREALNIAGETIYRVPSLSLPAWQELPADDTELAFALIRYESVRLFTERAIAVAPTFMLTSQNARALARICQRLDGIPLALELAAVRVKALSVEEIATRLNDQFNLLSQGDRTALPRQQTLRALIDWSYNLLTADERQLFNRLAVFVGGWTLPAAEVVCGVNDLDVLNLITQLVDKSLVIVDGENESMHYHLLETLRQYAQEKLQASADWAAIRQRHRDWFLNFVEQAEPQLHRAEQLLWLNRLQTEYANVLAALDWTVARADDVQSALRFASALYPFWDISGYWSEGRARLVQVLALPHAELNTSTRATTLVGAGLLALHQGDYADAQQSLEQATRIAKAIDAPPAMAYASYGLGAIAQAHGDYERAAALYNTGLETFRAINDHYGIGGALLNLGLLNLWRNQYEQAKPLLLSSLASFRQLGDKRNLSRVLNNLGLIEYHYQHYTNARSLYEESLAISREFRDKSGIAATLDNLGYIAVRLGDYEPARASFAECLVLFREMKTRPYIPDVLYGIAGAIAGLGKPERAAQIIGAADALLAALGIQVEAGNRVEYDYCAAMAREPMGAAAFESAHAIGCTLTMEQAIEYALVENMASAS